VESQSQVFLVTVMPNIRHTSVEMLLTVDTTRGAARPLVVCKSALLHKKCTSCWWLSGRRSCCAGPPARLAHHKEVDGAWCLCWHGLAGALPVSFRAANCCSYRQQHNERYNCCPCCAGHHNCMGATVDDRQRSVPAPTFNRLRVGVSQRTRGEV
jgi:hypothetical protein